MNSMMPAKIFAVLACMAISATGLQYEPGTPCDFSGLDVEGPINRMIEQLPESEVRRSIASNAKFLGVEFLPLKITGLNKIKRYGAIVPFCVNGTRMIQVDFAQMDGVALTLPWRTCTGKEGDLQLRAKISRFTTLFRVEATELGEVIRLVLEGPTIPGTTGELMIYAHGGGFLLPISMGYVSLVFPAALQEIWNMEFFASFVTSVRGVLA
uniref:Putative conserved secreted protein n=1 Tax=Amblyomma tuberculatum TaxID=48802 RepID=A0A6M2E4X0_9ACAR